MKVKGKKKNAGLRQLFRRKLEDAEVMPGASVREKLMRQVARKEFLRFNPVRLNIYYISGIIVAGLAVAALVLIKPGREVTGNTSVTQAGTVTSDTTRYIEIKKESPEIILQTANPVRKGVVSHTGKSFTDNKASDTSRQVSGTEHKAVEAPRAAIEGLSADKILTPVRNDTERLITVSAPEIVSITPQSSSGCAPYKVKFHYNAGIGDSCRWNFGDGGSSTASDPDWIFDVEGDYKILLQVFRHGNVPLTSTALVTVFPRPQAHFEILPEKAVLPNDEIHFLNYSTNASRCRWDFGDGTISEFFEPSHTYDRFSNYNVRLIVYSDQGCSDSLVVYNAFSGSQFYIDFPNAFMPNLQGPTGGYYSSKSDEAAQVFHPSFSGVSEYQLKIFSKLGILIFESNDVNTGWDGYNKGQLCESGVYIWKVRGKYRNGEPFTKMGDVTLLKN